MGLMSGSRPELTAVMTRTAPTIHSVTNLPTAESSASKSCIIIEKTNGKVKTVSL
jgi:hypothetical protein